MKLIDLKRRIDSSITLNSRAEESEVVVLVNGLGSIGPASSVPVFSANLGLDWNDGTFLIEPSSPLEEVQPSDAPLKVGTVFSGYCNGFFGRDSYGDKKVLAFGDDWIAARAESDYVELANFADKKERDFYVERWNNGL